MLDVVERGPDLYFQLRPGETDDTNSEGLQE